MHFDLIDLKLFQHTLECGNIPKNINGCVITVDPRVPIITDMIPKTIILRRPKNVLNAPSGTARKMASNVKIDRA